MPCKRDRYDIKRIETDANSALLILGVRQLQFQIKAHTVNQKRKPFVRFLRFLDGYLMGYDVFISYTWSDGREYADQLVNALNEKRYRCFLDSSEYKVGDDLSRDAQRAVKWSRALAIVVTERALRSKHVRKEIELFDLSAKPVVPIDVGDTLYQTEKGPNGEISYRISKTISHILSESTDEEQKQIKTTFELISRDRKLQINESKLNSPSGSTVDLLCERFDFTRKVSRRLRIIGATCIILIALVLVASWAWNEADKQRVKAEETLGDAIGVAKTITQEVDVELAEIPGAEVVRDRLLKSSHNMLESLLKKSPKNRKIEAVRGEVAQNQGSWHFRHRSLDIAKTKFEEALSIYSGFPENRDRLVRLLLNLGRTNRELRDLETAKQHYESASKLSMDLTDKKKKKAYEADALYGMGDILHDKAELEAALDTHMKAEALRRELVKELAHHRDAVYTEALLDLGASTDRIGHLHDQQRNLRRAKEYHNESYTISKELISLRPGNGQYRRDFALAASRLGYDFQREGDLAKSLQYYSEGEAELRSLVSLAPASKTYRYDWAIALSDLGDLSTLKKEFVTAKEYYQKSLVQVDQVIEVDPKNATVIGQKVVTLNSFAKMYKVSGNRPNALLFYNQALQLMNKKIQRWPNVPNQHYAKAIILKNIGDTLQSSKSKDSEAYFERSRQVLSELIKQYPHDLRYKHMLDSLLPPVP